MKRIALALLSMPAIANAQQCATTPWAAESNFALELAVGGCNMQGHVQSKTKNPANLDKSAISFQDFQYKLAAVPTNPVTNAAEIDVPMDILMGYRANWNMMSPSPSQSGFAGQINAHWNYVCNGMGAGIYAGIGYNSSRASSTIPASFSTNIDSFLGAKVAGGTAAETVKKDDVLSRENEDKTSNFLGRNREVDQGKATISSGLMFQAGARLGAMVGNVFPHVRLGWAIYQFKADMTNQYAPYTNSLDVQARAEASSLVDSKTGAGLVTMPGGNITDQQATVGMGQQMKAFDGAYHMPKAMKISSKGHKWANAITLGAGLDWAFNRMTLGFLYQVGICQKVTFKKWNKDVTAGLTAVNADYIPANATTVSPLKDEYQATGGSLNMVHDKATPEVSIAPVMHTAMVSMKYVLGKTA